MLESCMHLTLLGSLGENLEVEKAFEVVLGVEMRGGEAKTFNGDEVFMFRDRRDRDGYFTKKKKKTEGSRKNGRQVLGKDEEGGREILKDDQRKSS